MTDRLVPAADEPNDDRYREALRAAGRLVPDESVDWQAFHARLAARAELPLARLRYPHLAVEPDLDRPARELSLRASRWWEPAR